MQNPVVLVEHSSLFCELDVADDVRTEMHYPFFPTQKKLWWSVWIREEH